MNTITGTNGIDSLTGTDGDDVILPLWGFDTVDGGAGIDSLIIDYRLITDIETGFSLPITNISHIVINEDQSISGIVYAAQKTIVIPTHTVTFQGIEALDFTGSRGAETITVVARPLTDPNNLRIVGGGGRDWIRLDLSEIPNLNLSPDANGSLSGVWGSISNFIDHTIFLGSGVNNVYMPISRSSIVTKPGSENFIVTSGGVATNSSVDHISSTGTTANDSLYWGLNFQDSIDDLTFEYNASDRSASFSNGSSATGLLRGLFVQTGEGNDTINVNASGGALISPFISTGQGNDKVLLINANGEVDLGSGNDEVRFVGRSDSANGGDGIDRLTATNINVAGYYPVNITSQNGAFVLSDFQNFEHVDLTFTYEGLFFKVDASALQHEASLALRQTNNQLPDSLLEIDFKNVPNVIFEHQSNGLVRSEKFIFENFDFFRIQLGSGVNSVITHKYSDTVTTKKGSINTIKTQEGSDTITSNDSIDTIDAGAGSEDQWNANYQASKANLTFDYSFMTGQGSISNGTQVSNVERTFLRSGSGNDIFYIDGRVNFANGGQGFDILVGGFNLWNWGRLTFTVTGSDAISTFGTFQSFEKFELTVAPKDVNITLGDSNDVVRVGNYLHNITSPIVVAWVERGTSIFKMGGGDDIVISNGYADEIDGGAGIDTWKGDYSLFQGDIRLYWTGDGFGSFSVGSTLRSIERLEVTTGIGNDILNGAIGDDILISGAGNDRLFGLAGNDTLNGGEGDDIFSFRLPGSKAGIDVVIGGQGLDTIRGEANGVVIALESFTEIERIGAGGFADVTTAGSANANLFDFTGVTVTGISRINMMGGNDTVIGSDAADSILGSSGLDVISGGGRGDWLSGGIDSDTLSGGAGADVFDYNSVFESRLNFSADEITDFQVAFDKFDLLEIDANTLLTGDQSFSFIGTAAFNRVAGELRIDRPAGATRSAVQGDVNGDGVADLNIVLSNGALPKMTDFLL